MFGKQQDPSRTENATPKRVSKQRSEGHVPKSAELGKAVSLTAGMIGLYVWIGPMRDAISKIFRRFLDCTANFQPDPQNVYELSIDLSLQIAFIILPIILFLAFCSWLAQRIQVGKLWTTKIFKPKLQRFNLMKGLKNILFSPMTILRTIKSLLFCIILAIAAFDVWQSRYAYKEGMKMTKDEVKDERKQAEGDPVIKNQQKKKMMQVVMRRMMQDVPKADVVVTNPTHIAVALRYNATEAPAPVILAKGADRIAEKIKEIARENNVPIRENVPLARALYKATEVGDMIPAELYKAVAAVLASVWRMRPRAGRPAEANPQ